MDPFSYTHIYIELNDVFIFSSLLTQESCYLYKDFSHRLIEAHGVVGALVEEVGEVEGEVNHIGLLLCFFIT